MPNGALHYAVFERFSRPGHGRRASVVCLVAGITAALVAGGGDAAEAPAEAVAAAGIAPAAPAVERHRDWMLDCRAECRIETVVHGADGTAILTVSVGRDEPRVLRLETALPLFLPDPLEIVAGGFGPLRLPWLTCGASGCVVQAALEGDVMQALRGEREAQVGFTLVDGERVRLPVSLMGFTAAEEALDGSAPEARAR
jgi:invasion protein IalB